MVDPMNPDTRHPAEGSEEMAQATRLDDVRIREVRPLMSPALLQDDLPADEAVQRLRRAQPPPGGCHRPWPRPRLLVVVGPCSIHDHAPGPRLRATPALAVRRVAGRPAGGDARVLREAAHHRRLEGLHQRPPPGWQLPHQRGPARARQLLLDLARCAWRRGTEFLDLLSPQYISDLISWGAIGARTTESPSHRQLASGLSCPIGFKNGTDGGVQMAADALVACRAPPCVHGHDEDGTRRRVRDHRQRRLPHHPARRLARAQLSAADIDAACPLLRKAGVPERVMVDCSHANSAKDFGGELGRGGDDRAADRRRRAARPGVDDREPLEAGAAGPEAGRAARAWRVHHRRVHRVGPDGARAAASRAGGARPAVSDARWRRSSSLDGQGEHLVVVTRGGEMFHRNGM